MTLGARGDSYYEYLFKQFQLTGYSDLTMGKAYYTTADNVIDTLIKRNNDGSVIITQMRGDDYTSDMDHLACFAGGMFALGAQYKGLSETQKVLLREAGFTDLQLIWQKDPSMVWNIAVYVVTA